MSKGAAFELCRQLYSTWTFKLIMSDLHDVQVSGLQEL